MEARELRIGNWVQYSESGNSLRLNGWLIWQIESINKSVKPIPLTEEWLVKFGFEDKGVKYLATEKNLWIELDFNSPEYPVYNLFAKQIGLEGDESIVLFNIEIKYVHQLQNLYFALTGEELTIKEPVE